MAMMHSSISHDLLRRHSKSENQRWLIRGDDSELAASYEAALGLGMTPEDRRQLHREAAGSAPRIIR